MPVLKDNQVEARAPQYPPSPASLRAQALVYLKECKPTEYRQMKKDGELEKHLGLMVEACQRYAMNLKEQGVEEWEAWNLAIRQEILESPSD